MRKVAISIDRSSGIEYRLDPYQICVILQISVINQLDVPITPVLSMCITSRVLSYQVEWNLALFDLFPFQHILEASDLAPIDN